MKIPSDGKLALLQHIKEKRELLFGKFSSEVDHKMKAEAWNDILLKAKSLQLVTENRDAAYVRDKLYGVWKCRALVRKSVNVVIITCE